MLTATQTVELVRFQPESIRTRDVCRSLMAANPGVRSSSSYQGHADLLLLWGPGAPARMSIMRRQIAAGGHVVAFDLAYWQRDRKVRVSIDAAHPQAWVMRKDWPADRFQSDPISRTVTDAWNPQGPIIVAGVGAKALAQYGDNVVSGWECAQIARCRARWPRPVLYRFKREIPSGPIPSGASACARGEIDAVLKGASLVVTWHSNVAVDAIRLGIPVVCHDGAAAAVCPSQVEDTHRPLSQDVRDRFLQNLAWFQWDMAKEASACWKFLMELLG